MERSEAVFMCIKMYSFQISNGVLAFFHKDDILKRDVQWRK